MTKREIFKMIKNRFDEILAHAEEIAGYKIDCDIFVDLKSVNTIGLAYPDKIRINVGVFTCPNLLDHVLNDTIAHEVAHVLGRTNPLLYGKNHDAKWKYYARLLGSDGNRICDRQDIRLKSGRKVRKFVYILEDGSNITLTSVRHNRIQKQGKSYITRSGLTVNRFCKFREIIE